MEDLNLKKVTFQKKGEIYCIQCWQYDSGQKIKISGPGIAAGQEVQWSYNGIDGIEPTEIIDVDGYLYADIPDAALLKSGTGAACGYIYGSSGNSGNTFYKIIVNVLQRPPLEISNPPGTTEYVTNLIKAAEGLALYTEYNAETGYTPGMKVTHNGSSYVNIKACAGVIPTNTEYWLLIAAKGDKGDQGIPGGDITTAAELPINNAGGYLSADNVQTALLENAVKSIHNFALPPVYNKLSVFSAGTGTDANKNSVNYSADLIEGPVFVSLRGREPIKNELNYTLSTYEEWLVSAGVTKDATGIEMTLSSTAYRYFRLPTNVKPSTKYGLLFYIAVNTATVHRLNINKDLTGSYISFDPAGVTGNVKLVFTTQATITQNRLFFSTTYIGDEGKKIKVSNLRLFELPAGSQIEADFQTLTADQLAAKYPYIQGGATRVALASQRIRCTDGMRESVSYIKASGLALRKSYAGIYDEVRWNGGTFEHVKRLDESLNVLTTPIVTTLETPDVLTVYPGGTIYIDPYDGGVLDTALSLVPETVMAYPTSVAHLMQKIWQLQTAVVGLGGTL